MAESVFYQLSSADPDTGNYTRAEGTPPYDVTGLPTSEHRFIAPDGTVHLVTPQGAPVLAAYPGTPYQFDEDIGAQTIPAPINSGGPVDTWSLVGNSNGDVAINASTGIVTVQTDGVSFLPESFTTRAENAAGNSDQSFTLGVGASDPFEGLHSEGLIADWRFSEGSGNTVADETGTSGSIDLTLPTDPNATWETYGMRTQAGLIQTPSVTGAYTVCILYWTDKDDNAGFEISGGSQSGSGLQGAYFPVGAKVWLGQGMGVTDIPHNTTSGVSAWKLKTGGWRVLIYEQTQAYNSPYGLGGRHSTTTSRCADYRIAWCGIYDDVLTEAERDSIYATMRNVAKARGVYIDTRDCPTQVDGVVLLGHSNAMGRAKIADLSAPDQSRTYTRTYIRSNGLSTASAQSGFELLEMGVNQQTDAPSTDFGPEIGIAMDHEDGSNTRDLYIAKMSVGSSYLASSDLDGGIGPGSTWSTIPVFQPHSSSIYNAPTTAFWENYAITLEQGIGINYRYVFMLLGENDAARQLMADGVQASLEAWLPEMRALWGPDFTLKVVRPHPSGTATYTTQVVTDMTTAIATLNGAEAGSAEWIDTDDLAIPDGVHFDGASMKIIGQRLYNSGDWS